MTLRSANERRDELRGPPRESLWALETRCATGKKPEAESWWLGVGVERVRGVAKGRCPSQQYTQRPGDGQRNRHSVTGMETRAGDDAAAVTHLFDDGLRECLTHGWSSVIGRLAGSLATALWRRRRSMSRRRVAGRRERVAPAEGLAGCGSEGEGRATRWRGEKTGREEGKTKTRTKRGPAKEMLGARCSVFGGVGRLVEGGLRLCGSMCGACCGCVWMLRRVDVRGGM